MEGHDHKVGFYEGDQGSSGWNVYASGVEIRDFGTDGERFAFCPECGASLAAFWQGIDQAREAYRQQLEREEQEKCLAWGREASYRNTPPT